MIQIRLDSENSKQFIFENDKGIQGIALINGNSFLFQQIQKDFFEECSNLLAEYILMKYQTVIIQDFLYPLEGWIIDGNTLTKNRSSNPYTMCVFQKETL